MEIDPVCHMEVDPKNPPGGTAEHKGKTYYFCSPGCRKQFTDDPEKFLKTDSKEDPEGSGFTLLTLTP